MKLYVISSKYQPLVAIGNLHSSFFLSRKNVSILDLKATFNASKENSLIACNNKEDALSVMACLLKAHNTKPELIERGVNFFAVPVVYTVVIDEATLPPETTLTAYDLIDYSDTTTIPLYVSYNSYKSAERIIINDKLQQYEKTIAIRKIAGLQLGNVTDASYLQSSGSSIVDVSFTPATNGLFAWLGKLIPVTHQPTRTAEPRSGMQ